MITREADLVTAHEFGHNWGSEHDPDLPECSPKASEGGSYLMYTYSVSPVTNLFIFHVFVRVHLHSDSRQNNVTFEIEVKTPISTYF